MDSNSQLGQKSVAHMKALPSEDFMVYIPINKYSNVQCHRQKFCLFCLLYKFGFYRLSLLIFYMLFKLYLSFYINLLERCITTCLQI